MVQTIRTGSVTVNSGPSTGPVTVQRRRPAARPFAIHHHADPPRSPPPPALIARHHHSPARRIAPSPSQRSAHPPARPSPARPPSAAVSPAAVCCRPAIQTFAALPLLPFASHCRHLPPPFAVASPPARRHRPACAIALLSPRAPGPAHQRPFHQPLPAFNHRFASRRPCLPAQAWPAAPLPSRLIRPPPARPPARPARRLPCPSSPSFTHSFSLSPIQPVTPARLAARPPIAICRRRQTFPCRPSPPFRIHQPRHHRLTAGIYAIHRPRPPPAVARPRPFISSLIIHFIAPSFILAIPFSFTFCIHFRHARLTFVHAAPHRPFLLAFWLFTDRSPPPHHHHSLLFILLGRSFTRLAFTARFTHRSSFSLPFHSPIRRFAALAQAQPSPPLRPPALPPALARRRRPPFVRPFGYRQLARAALPFAHWVYPRRQVARRCQAGFAGRRRPPPAPLILPGGSACPSVPTYSVSLEPT